MNKAKEDLTEQILNRRSRTSSSRRRPDLETLLARVNFAEDEHSYSNKSGPNLLFWKYFIEKGGPSLRVNIPDTIVANEYEKGLFWVYTDEKGFVRTTESFSPKDVLAKFSSEASPGELVALVKKKHYSNFMKCECKLVNCKALPGMVTSTLQVGTELAAFQRFVKCKGPNPFICRSIYRRNGVCEAWVITNKSDKVLGSKPADFVVDTSTLNNCSVVHTRKGAFLKETVHYLSEIANFVRAKHKLWVQELGGDFVKDEGGVWWLVGVKHFRLGEERAGRGGREENYQKTRVCNYCEGVYLQTELNFRMTTKMIIETDKFMAHRGKAFEWLRRSEINNLEKDSLYQEHIVCLRCYHLYSFSERLLSLELAFAVRQGVPAAPGSKYQLTSAGTRGFDLAARERALSTLREGLPQRIDIGGGCELSLQDRAPVKSDNNISQMLRFRLILFLSSIYEVCGTDAAHQYYIEYSLFAQKVRFRVDLAPDAKKAVLNRFRVFYLFAPSMRAMSDYLAHTKSFRLSVMAEDARTKSQELFASLEVEVSDLSSDKVPLREFYKMFNIRNGSWGWGLSASMGIVSSGLVDTSRLVLLPHENVYLPPSDFFTCEPLPPEWENIIKGLPNVPREDQSQPNKTESTQPRHRSADTALTLPIKLGPPKRRGELSFSAILSKEILSYSRESTEIKRRRRRRL